MAVRDITELLRNIDLPTLRQFASETIIKAITSVVADHYEGQLCSILKQKYGAGILTKSEIRLSILDGLTKDEAEALSVDVGLKPGSHAESCAALQRYFLYWDEKRSDEFVTFFNLSPEYKYSKVVDSRSSKQVVVASHGDHVVLKGFLHGYQKRVKDEMILRATTAGLRFVVQMPTGSGKTYTALEVAVDLFRYPRNNRFVVWLVDSNELAEQAFETFSDLWRLKGDRPLALFRLFHSFSCNFRAENGGMVFTSFDKLHSVLDNPDHALSQAVWHLVENTQLLIVDEAHTSVAPTHQECIRAFIDTDTCVVMGMTATPGRRVASEAIDLARLYTTTLIAVSDESGNSVSDPIKYLQAQNYLARLKVEVLETNAQARGTEDQVCRTLAENSSRNKIIVEQIKLAAEAKQSTLVFACTLDHVFALKILCSASGIDGRVITGSTPQATRISLLDAFRKEAFYILINLDLLSTGIDIPNVSKIIITRPVGSPILYSQILGRALRGPSNGGRSDNTVLTLKDNLSNYPSVNLVYSYFSEDWNKPSSME